MHILVYAKTLRMSVDVEAATTKKSIDLFVKNERGEKKREH